MDTRLNQMELIDSNPNRLAVDEVNTHIQTSSARNLQVTVKSILTKFSNAPYGWKDIDIQAIIITLFKKQEIKVILNGEVLTPNNTEVVNYVTKRDYVERVILKTREKVNQKYIDAARDLNKDLFGFSSLPSDEDGIMGIFKEECKKEISRINEMLVNFTFKTSYPGEQTLKEGKRLFTKVIDITDTIDFFKEVYDLEDDFLDYADTIDEIKGFFYKKENGRIEFSSKGEQRIIFDNALDKLNNYEDNKEYIVNDDIKAIIEEIRGILRMSKPYSKIPTIPLLIETYNNKIVSLLEEESVPVKGFIEMCKKEVFETLEAYDFKHKFEHSITEEFNNLYNRVSSASSFAVLSSMPDLAEKVKLRWIKEIVTEDERVKRIKAKEIEEANRVLEREAKGETQTATVTYKPEPVPEVVIKTKTLSMRELVKGQKTIKNTDDIDEVVEALRAKLRKELEKDTIISLV